MFTMRDSAMLAAVREFIASGRLGEVMQIQISAQHPLLFGTRPDWYFKDGMHGGTINDIGCHAFDILPYLTGHAIKAVTAARTWQAQQTNSNFCDAGQFMLELANGCGVMCDVSYSAPASQGYTHPCYWRFNIWGTNGMMEFKASDQNCKLYLNGSDHEELMPVKADFNSSYLETFLQEIAGQPTLFATKDVLEAANGTPPDVVDAKFRPVEEDVEEVIVCTAHIEMDCSASIGYDREGKHWTADEQII